MRHTPMFQVVRDFLDEFRAEFDNDTDINGGDCVDKWAEYRERFYDAYIGFAPMPGAFTRGPWAIVGENAGQGYSIEAPSGVKHYRKRIGHTVGFEPAKGSKDVGISQAEALANAQLIVDAPALLEKLDYALRFPKALESNPGFRSEVETLLGKHIKQEATV